MRRRVTLLPLFLLIAASCGGDGGGGSGTEGTAGATLAGSTRVGTAGGEVSSPDGRLTLSIPAGALSENVDISVSSPPRQEWPEDVIDLEPLAVYHLEPDGLEFEEPVSFEIESDLDERETAEARPPVMLVRNSDGLYEPVDLNWRFSSQGGTAVVSGTLDHFSYVLEIDGPLQVMLEEIDPKRRVKGDEWSVWMELHNIGRSVRPDISFEIEITLILPYGEEAVEVLGAESQGGITLKSSSWEEINPVAALTCASVGDGAYGVVVEGQFDPGDLLIAATTATSDTDAISGPKTAHYRVDARVEMKCTGPPDDEDDNTTGDPEPTGNTTATEEPTTLVVPGTCEMIIADVATPGPCVVDGDSLPGTVSTVSLDDGQLIFQCGPGCGEAADWPFQQHAVELMLGDELLIVCDNDPAFPCQLVNPDTFELVSPEAAGVHLPVREIAANGIDLVLDAPWGVGAETGRLEIGGVGITSIVTQWWHGDDPMNSEISLLTIELVELDLFSEQLLELGRVTVVSDALEVIP